MEIFKNSAVPPKRKLTKFMVTKNAVVQVMFQISNVMIDRLILNFYLKPGTPLYASHYRVGDYVDVGAKTYKNSYLFICKF